MLGVQSAQSDGSGFAPWNINAIVLSDFSLKSTPVFFSVKTQVVANPRWHDVDKPGEGSHSRAALPDQIGSGLAVV